MQLKTGKFALIISFLFLVLFQSILNVSVAQADNGVSFRYDERNRLTKTDVVEAPTMHTPAVGGEYFPKESSGFLSNLLSFFKDLWNSVLDWFETIKNSMPDWLLGVIKGVLVALIVVAAVVILALTGTIGVAVAIAAAIGAVIAGAIYGLFVGGANFRFWEGLFISTIGAFLSAFLYTSGAIASILNFARLTLARPFQAFWAEVRFAGSFLWRGISGAGRLLASELGLAGRTIWGAFGTAGRSIGTAFQSGWNLIRTGGWSAIGGALRTIGGGLVNAGRTLSSGFIGMLRHTWTGISGAFQSIWSGMSSAGSAFWRGITSGFGTFRAGVTSIWSALRPELSLTGAITSGALYSGLGTFAVEMIKWMTGMQEFDAKSIAISVGLSLIPGAIFGKFMGTVGQLWQSKKWGQLLLWTVPISTASGLENLIGEIWKTGNGSFNDFMIGYVTASIVHGTGLFLFSPSLKEYVNVITGKVLEEGIKTGVGNIANWYDPSKDKENYLKKFKNYVSDSWNNFVTEAKFYYNRTIDYFTR